MPMLIILKFIHLMILEKVKSTLLIDLKPTMEVSHTDQQFCSWLQCCFSVPGPVSDLKIDLWTPEVIFIRWNRPKEPHGLIVQYYIELVDKERVISIEKIDSEFNSYYIYLTEETMNVSLINVWAKNFLYNSTKTSVEK